MSNTKELPDHHFLASLSRLGILAAASELGLEVHDAIRSLATAIDHPYRSYRWSTAVDEHGRLTIHARPPEEETGWTPWERWVRHPDGHAQRQEWVAFPTSPSSPGKPWLLRGGSGGELVPRHAGRSNKTLTQLLEDARVPEAAEVLGLDFAGTFAAIERNPCAVNYRQFRWAVIPHYLGADQPVIYALPPMDRSDVWPWESWYGDGSGPLIHHVHFTKANEKTTGEWQELPDAPQRPPEVFGVRWFWYDAPSMRPALAD